MLGTKEFYDAMDFFDRTDTDGRKDKEDKALWPKGCYYQHGERNEKFKTFLSGYMLARSVYLNN